SCRSPTHSRALRSFPTRRSSDLGILDRLERGGWVVRERDASDRRAVVIRAVRERYADLLRLYSGMSRSMNKILAEYSDAELELIDRKSTRLNSSHLGISYAVFCL